jgi:RimJ/RimL family protein N-acetyltransferase
MVHLKGSNIELRPALPEDVEARLALGNPPDIVEMFGTSRQDVKPLTREDAERWVRHHIDNPNAWIIAFQNRLIGSIRLDRLNVTDRRAFMAIGIYDPQLLGQGLGSEAIRLLLRHAFENLRLHRIGIRVLAHNSRAIRAYQKCGFVIEGRERETAFIDGVWHDDVMMGLLETEFSAREGEPFGAAKAAAARGLERAGDSFLSRQDPAPNPSPQGGGA